MNLFFMTMGFQRYNLFVYLPDFTKSYWMRVRHLKFGPLCAIIIFMLLNHLCSYHKAKHILDSDIQINTKYTGSFYVHVLFEIFQLNNYIHMNQFIWNIISSRYFQNFTLLAIISRVFLIMFMSLIQSSCQCRTFRLISPNVPQRHFSQPKLV